VPYEVQLDINTFYCSIFLYLTAGVLFVSVKNDVRVSIKKIPIIFQRPVFYLYAQAIIFYVIHRLNTRTRTRAVARKKLRGNVHSYILFLGI